MTTMLNLMKTLVITVFLVGTPLEPVRADYSSRELRDLASTHTMKVYVHGGGHGTGFQISKNGRNYIITNRHVCEGNKGSLEVKYVNSDNIFRVQVIKQDDSHDLCILQAPSNDVISGLNIANRLQIGEYVSVLGYPLNLPATFTEGMYSGKTEVVFYLPPSPNCRGKTIFEDVFGLGLKIETCVETYEAGAMTAPIFPGNSGSAVLNKNGEVVGVVFAGRNGVSVASFFVPLEYLQKFIKETI